VSPSGAKILTAFTGSETDSNEQFRAIVAETPECVKIVAPDGTLLFMNTRGLGMVGAPFAEAVVGKNVYDMIAAEDRERFREFNERVCRGDNASLEFDIVGLKGARCHVESHGTPLRYADGGTVHLGIMRNVTERKEEERAPWLLSAIVDSSEDAIISKDLDGVITSWNSSAARLFGYTATEAIGQPVAALLIPKDRQNEEPDILARLKRGERVDHFETVRQRKDGALLDISLTISPVKDAQGGIIGASKIARDISDRRRAEKAIETLNAQLTTDLAAMTRLQQLSIRPMQIEDFATLLTEIIAAAIEMTGADMGNIQLLEDGALKIVAHRGFERAFLDFFSSIHEGEAACGIAMERGERVIVEDVATSRTFGGKPSLALMLGAGARALQSTPLVTRGGDLLGRLSTFYRTPHRPADRDLRLLDILARQTADLIERKRAEGALLASERWFRQLADAMPQLLWTARPDGYVDYYNDQWYEFTGVSRNVFGNESWEPALHPEDLQRTRETWAAALAAGTPYNIEYRLWEARRSRWRWFVGRALPVRDPRGNLVKWFGSCTDIDEQKTVQEDLRRANQDLEQFAFTASHDLQEPLRSIKIYSELLAKRYGGAIDGDALKFVRYLRTAATRLETLVRDLLSYTQVSKLENGAERADAAEALNLALANLAGAVSEAGATITTEPLPSLSVHSTHLEQLFQNMIGNAIKYRSPEGPPVVRVTAERENGHWIIAVSDNGIGIDPEYKENIFGLFKRLHTNDAYPGTGIGLAICRRIVDRYNGRIWVESEPGRGSIFRVTLPV
jgi:PAS domain S-box-containing protein